MHCTFWILVIGNPPISSRITNPLSIHRQSLRLPGVITALHPINIYLPRKPISSNMLRHISISPLVVSVGLLVASLPLTLGEVKKFNGPLNATSTSVQFSSVRHASFLHQSDMIFCALNFMGAHTCLCFFCFESDIWTGLSCRSGVYRLDKCCILGNGGLSKS